MTQQFSLPPPQRVSHFRATNVAQELLNPVETLCQSPSAYTPEKMLSVKSSAHPCYHLGRRRKKKPIDRRNASERPQKPYSRSRASVE